jgi:hypothetical protein
MTIHSVEYKISGNINDVYPFIFDLRKFGSLHPYMEKVSKTGDNLYLIEESVKLFGIIPMKPVYSAFVSKSGTGILYTSKVQKGVDLKISFDLIEDPVQNMTLITETIEITANKVIAAILLQTMKKAHLIAFQSMESTLRSKKCILSSAPLS